MRGDLDTELLRAFAAIVDAGGFTAAARALNRTQSAVSMQIKRLEDLTETRLFDRNGRSVSLTRDGETLLGYARRMIALNDEALSTLSDNQVEGTVRLGLMEDYGACILPKILERFQATHPRVHVEAETGLTKTMLGDLGMRYDLVLAMHSAGSGMGELLRRERTVWACSRLHAPHHLSPVPVALYRPGCLFREWAVKALDHAGVPWRTKLVGSSVAVITGAVAAGLAVSVFKGSTLPEGFRVIGPEDGLPPLPDSEIALHRSPAEPLPAATKLAEFIGDMLRDPHLEFDTNSLAFGLAAE